MSAPQIPPYTGEIPQRGTQSPDEFSQNADTWVAYQPTQISGTNDATDFVNAKATEASSAADAATAAISALNFVGSWSSLTGALNVPALVYHSDRYWQLLNDLADVTASEPGVTSDWAESSGNTARISTVAPATLPIPGRYYVSGTGAITLPDPTTLSDGAVYDFSIASGAAVTVTTPITGGISTKLGDYDTLDANVTSFELVVNAGKYEV